MNYKYRLLPNARQKLCSHALTAVNYEQQRSSLLMLQTRHNSWCLGGVGRSIKVIAGSIPRRGTIKSPRSIQPPSGQSGVGKSSTSLIGWGSGGVCSLVSGDPAASNIVGSQIASDIP